MVASGSTCAKSGKEYTTRCHHRGAAEDSVRHTLEHYPTRAGERESLTAIISEDLSLPVVVRAMVESERT